MFTSPGKACLLIITVFLTNSEALKFSCSSDNFKCLIEDWNPTVDGYFIFQHIPNATISMRFINLQSSHIAPELCRTVTHFVDSLIIHDSPKVSMVFVPSTCNITILALENTGQLFLDFERNESLQSVLVKNSRLRIIPATIVNLPNVVYFILEHVDVEAIDLNLFYPFRHLKTLKIGHGKIKYVRGTSMSTDRCPLDSLKLDHNSLSIVSLNLFAPFTSLTLLNLAHNRIKVITGRPSNPKLASLLLNNNRLKVLDLCPWNVLHHLNAVTIAGNYFTRMPLCLNRFQNVTYVSMQFNQINDIEVEQLKQLAGLVSINLSFNNISSIPVNESLYPRKLKQLDLCGNPIRNDSIPGRRIGKIDVFF